MQNNLETLLDKYAELIIKVGVNLQAGQALFVDAFLESAPLVRLVAKHAYLNGARLVEVLWNDDELTRIRFQYAPRDSFAETPLGFVAAANQYAAQGDAYLAITGKDPDLLREQDPALVAQFQSAYAAELRPSTEAAMRDTVNWLVVGASSPKWAARVFPNLAPADSGARLWETIFQACRVNTPNPIAEWETHTRALAKRRDALTERNYAALHFSAPETDLTVGLADEHVWIGGATSTERGIPFMGNMPTEEVFTMPHRERANGSVTSVLPLSVRGCVIEKLTFTFENGRVTRATASNDQAVLDGLLAMDEGALHLGEVALVPHHSPVSASGILFYNTLFDENAASHLALGKSYPTNLRDGKGMNPNERAARGANDSLLHLDFMIGSGEMNVDGIRADGAREALMRNGEWAFALA